MSKYHIKALRLLSLTVIFTGCTSIPSEEAGRLSAAAKAYDSIELAMTREKILSMLGPPQESEGNESTWETRYGRRNFDRVKVRFDAEGGIQMIGRRQYRSDVWAFGKFKKSSDHPSSYD